MIIMVLMITIGLIVMMFHIDDKDEKIAWKLRGNYDDYDSNILVIFYTSANSYYLNVQLLLNFMDYPVLQEMQNVYVIEIHSRTSP